MKYDTTLYIQGGIGNQMFQYAYGRALELQGKKVRFDTSFYHTHWGVATQRVFLLPAFRLMLSTPGLFERPSLFQRIRYGADRIQKWVYHLWHPDFHDGYWQSERYFRGTESIIRQEFILKDPLGPHAQIWLEKISKTPNTISIHIRRGDYISHPQIRAYITPCSQQYYHTAIQSFRETIPSPTFFIFSDDIEWARAHLPLDHAHYVSSPDLKDYEEMILMSQCTHHIIANSTFSWWGAWLNARPDAIVIAPSQWTRRESSDMLGILPPSWKQVSSV